MRYFPPLTIEQQADTLARILPGGRLFAAKFRDGSTMRKLLLGFAVELFRIDETFQLTLDEHDMRTTTLFIEEWEGAVGIPDDCFDGTGIDAFRRQAIVAKFAQMNLQTEQDFLDLATLFGFTVTLTPGGDVGVFPLLFPIVFFTTTKEAKHTLIIDLPESENVFPLDFPIQFGGAIQNLIQCLFNKLKPASVDILYRFGI